MRAARAARRGRAQIVRAWRDHEYWSSLSERQRATVLTNPAGVVELLDAEVEELRRVRNFTGTDCTMWSVAPPPCCK
jgi:mersacidin/lichenicidin family type 2 lantibiotic